MAAYTYVLSGHGKFKGRCLSVIWRNLFITCPFNNILASFFFFFICVRCDGCIPSAGFLVQFPMYFLAGDREHYNNVLCNTQGHSETAAYHPRRQLTRSIALVGIYTQPENWVNIYFCINCGFSSRLGFPNAFCTIVWGIESCLLFHLFTKTRLQMLPTVKERSS